MGEFDDFVPPSGAEQPANGVGGGEAGGLGPVSVSSRMKLDPVDRIKELEAEMKLLRWHKLANEAALKAALIRTKKLKDTDRRNPMAQQASLAEKAEWMHQIIEEEQSKPLQVDEVYIRKYEIEETREAERLDTEVNRHIDCLNRLRQSLNKRESQKSLKGRYKVGKMEMDNERQAFNDEFGISEGQPGSHTLRRPGAGGKKGRQNGAPGTQAPSEGGGGGGGMGATQGSVGSSSSRFSKPPPGRMHGTLGTVINSLDKLVELEKRITKLERDNVYDDATGGMTMSFTKKKTEPTITSPSKTYYSVKTKTSQRGGAAGGARGARGGVGAGARRPVRGGGGAGASMSGGVRGRAQGVRRAYKQMGQRVSARLPRVGGKNVAGSGRAAVDRNRARAARARQKEERRRKDAARQNKQDRTIKDWLRKKKGRTAPGMAGAAVRARQRKAGMGRPVPRGPMQQFNQLRQQFERKKDDFRKQMSKRGTGGGSGALGARALRQNRTTGSVPQASRFGGGRGGGTVRRTGARTTGVAKRGVGVKRRVKAARGGTKLPRIAKGGTRRQAW